MDGYEDYDSQTLHHNIPENKIKKHHHHHHPITAIRYAVFIMAMTLLYSRQSHTRSGREPLNAFGFP